MTPFLLKEYLSNTLNHPDITWSSDVKVALGFKLNALALMDVYKDGIEVPTGQTLKLSEQQIITDGSGYPSAKKMKNLWGLDPITKFLED